MGEAEAIRSLSVSLKPVNGEFQGSKHYAETLSHKQISKQIDKWLDIVPARCRQENQKFKTSLSPHGMCEAGLENMSLCPKKKKKKGKTKESQKMVFLRSGI